MTSNFSVQIDRIRRYKWLVAAITVISTLGALAAALPAKSEFTAQAVLSTASLTRGADQDATLAQGYVVYFNDPAFQSGLADRAGISGDVTAFGAHTAGLSPLFYVDATATTAAAARDAAAAMAKTFADEVNARLEDTRDSTIEAMTTDFDTVWGARLAAGDAEAAAAQAKLQERINDLNANPVNRLTVMQLDGGVTEMGSNRIQTVGLGLAGGLLLGCVLAIGLSIRSRRIVTDYDLAEKSGLEVLEVIPSSAQARFTGLRDVRLAHLANIVAKLHPTAPTVLVVASPAGSRAAADVAEAVASHRAAQGISTVLLQADLHNPTGSPGLTDLLETGTAPSILRRTTSGLRTVETGKTSTRPEALLNRESVADLFAELRPDADLIVVAAPPLARTPESQVLADLADLTLVVIEQGTAVADVAEAVRVLGQVATEACGFVLVESSRHGSESRRTARRAADTVGAGVAE